MNRRILGPAAVVVVVLIAGCAGFVSEGDSTSEPLTEESPTSTHTAPTQTTTPTPPAEQLYPAGWSQTGVENATVALQSHYLAVLTGSSTTVTYRSRAQSTGNNRTQNTTLGLQITPRSQRAYARMVGTDARREVFFSNGTLSRWSVDNRTVLGQSEATFAQVAQSVDRSVLKSQLLLYKLNVNRTIRQGSTSLLIYEITGVYQNAISRRMGSPTAGRGQVVVSSTGRVLAINATVTYTNGKEAYKYAQRQIGETEIEPPDWVQRG